MQQQFLPEPQTPSLFWRFQMQYQFLSEFQVSWSVLIPEFIHFFKCIDQFLKIHSSVYAQFVYLSLIYPFIHPPIHHVSILSSTHHLTIHHSLIHLFIYFIHPFVHTFVHVSTQTSIQQSISLAILVCYFSPDAPDTASTKFQMLLKKEWGAVQWCRIYISTIVLSLS